jgi:hypothetical protein
MQGDLVELIGESSLCSRAAYPLEPLSKSLGNRFGLGFACELGKRTCELFGFLAADVQSHKSPRVERLLHSSTFAVKLQ